MPHPNENTSVKILGLITCKSSKQNVHLFIWLVVKTFASTSHCTLFHERGLQYASAGYSRVIYGLPVTGGHFGF